MKIKNPEAPATDPQINAIVKLCEEKGQAWPTMAGLTKGQASAHIDSLISHGMLAGAAPAAAATVVAAEPVGDDREQFNLTEDHCKAISAAFGVVEMEAGELSETDQEVMAAIDVALAAFKARAEFKASFKTAKPEAVKVELPTVPEGRYAVTGEQGKTAFYVVEHGKGKWDGFTFLSQQLSDDYQAVKLPKVKAAILAKIAKDPKAASIRYGKELGVCGVCNKTLTSEWKDLGIGPVCAKNTGWTL